MIGEGDFRVGDVLSVACPFTVTTVERGVTWDHVSVRWPWWEIDSGNEFAHWNGIVALGVDGGGSIASETEPELFRTDPPPEHLKAGDVCRVGVPPTVVHVTGVDHHDPPLETAWLPRPTETVPCCAEVCPVASSRMRAISTARGTPSTPATGSPSPSNC
ncbi:hypothetical protein ACIRJR_06850 [Streptomyces sp. NPDC102402]|uniref:hypothetical protein n=1 Tax=Streptomyces sp. NPDC102402 TaxID=3366169 RepID=UPI0038166F09